MKEVMKMKVTCLFEQSGIFKHAFERVGHNAIDIDISNKFDETNMICDIFDQLDCCVPNFDFYVDVLRKSDLIIAFFPCTWFSNFNTLIWSRKWKNFKYGMFKTEQDITVYINDRRAKYNRAVNCLFKLIDLCKRFGKPLIIENPVSTEIIKLLGEPSYTDNNRSLHGDNFKKPTAYYCFDCHITPLDIIPREMNKNVLTENKGINRSLINPVYADNFVKHIVIDYVDIHDYDRIDLKHNNKVLQEMIKVLKGANK